MDFFNPTYRIVFDINKTHYIMEIRSKVELSIFDLEKDFLTNDYKGIFDVTVSYQKKSGFYSLHDARSFNSYSELMDYIENYRQLARPIKD